MDFAKSKRKTREHKTSFLKIILILSGLLFLLTFFWFFSDFFKSVDGRVNFIVAADNLSVYSYNRDESSLIIIPVPKNLILNLAYEKGEVQSSSLLRFDKNLNYKGKLLTATVREYFGIPIDGYIESANEVSDLASFEKVINSDLSFFNVKTIFDDLFRRRSDMSAGTLRRLLLNLTSIRKDRIEIIDLEKAGITESEKLADETEVLNTDTQKIDSVFNTKFFETVILKERLSIAVSNGTEKPGIAGKAGRIISNIGGNVITVSDSDNKYVTCSISVNKKYANSYTVKRIKDIFNCDVNDVNTEDRADVMVNLGKNYENEVANIIF
ncbi:MAG: LytR C-terminal domain-containing protein [Patescibacteria group bacterium]|nr:LytR C-terminal domain-containing protein [Patescibacteria group bacterium]